MALVETLADLRTRGFSYAALYFENPELVEGLRLDDILALQKDIQAKVPKVTVQAANHVRELLPKDGPLSLEDAYLIASIHGKNRGRADADKACGFFHATYFFTPFPQEREAGEFYASPARLIQHLATQQETEENVAFAERVMGRLLTFYNTELQRMHNYNTKILRGQLSDEEKAKLATEAQLDLRGYNGEFLRDGKQLEPYPSNNFHHDMQHVAHAWIRPLYGTHLEDPVDIVGLARIYGDTDFAKKLSQLFRDIVKENPLKYFDPPFMKNVLEQPL